MHLQIDSERPFRARLGASHRRCKASPIPELDGGDLAGKTILVRAYTPGTVRLARFIAPVAKQARRCIVLA